MVIYMYIHICPHRLEKLAKSMLAEPCRNPLFRPYLVQRIGPNSRSSAETIANRKSFWVRYFRSLTLNIQDSDSGFEVKTFGIAIHIALKSLPKAGLQSPVEIRYFALT